MANPNFLQPPVPLVFDANGGLRQLNWIQRICYWFKIQAFKIKVPNQPNFFISTDSWKLLINGSGQDQAGSWQWLQEGYEVYAFVFCVAFERERKYSRANGYFRVRTILKNTKTGDIQVSPNNIAFGNLSYALGTSKSERSDDLEFVRSEKDGVLERINEEVIIKPDLDTFGNPAIIPNSFKENIGSKKERSIISNEGNIFSKYRIWDDILTNYSDATGTYISLAWNRKTKAIILNFKVNPEYEATVPCPPPPVCY